MQRISVFGLGKVGHVLAICLADAGHEVIGVDLNEHIVNELNSGTFHSFEPGVMSRFKKVNHKRFTATCDGEYAVIEDARIASQLSEDMRKQGKSTMILGTKGFDGKFYLLGNLSNRSFFLPLQILQNSKSPSVCKRLQWFLKLSEICWLSHNSQKNNFFFSISYLFHR